MHAAAKVPTRTKRPMRVLLIEDDRMIGEGLSHGLAAEGYSVDWVRDGPTAETALRVGGHALALLDLGLPGADGLQVLRSARTAGNDTSVLIITARDGLDSRVVGLDLGADDYLVKPFEMRELLARMRAILRRRAGRATGRLVAAETELDTESHVLSHAGTVAVLSAREYALIHALMERPGRILSRAQIEERIYGWGEEVESNAVDALILTVRRKVGKGVILNVRGAGWMVPKP
ncbi:two-component system OmpR family response regulator [Methylobacterium sp. PvP062]|nr:Transcriptional regulatory protein QseB [Methylobacterium persicinum]